MNGETGRVARMEEAMEELAVRKPYSKDIFGAFKPILAARRRLIEKLAFGNVESPQVDERGFRGGVPLIRQWNLFLPDDPWREIAEGLIPAILEGLPRLREDLDRVLVRLRGNEISPFASLQRYVDTGDDVVQEWAAACRVQTPAVRLFLDATAQIILEKRAGDLAPLVRDLPWEKGFCPICGAFPILAVIREKGQRWLHCSVCSHDWRFARIACPGCERGGERGVTYFYVEDEKDESVFVCEQCKRYILTVTRVDALGDADPDAIAIGLVHLDVIMQEKGFQPLASCAWNRF